MLKTVGCIITVAVGAALGIRAADRLRCRYKKLLSHYLYIGEISDLMRTGAPLEEVFASNSAKGLVESEGYRVQVLCDDLNRDDRRLLSEFFSGLGMGDLDAGIARCATYRELLYKRVSDAEQEMKQKSRIYSLLGVFSGIMTAILFI